jgi:hypothetical protein
MPAPDLSVQGSQVKEKQGLLPFFGVVTVSEFLRKF